MASVDLIIRGGTVITAAGETVADIAIVGESIAEIAPNISGSARDEIDATGLHILPGQIDPHVHFNEPGRTEWEGFASGSAALAAGGGTLFFEMPLNASPPTLDAASFDLKRAAAEENSLTDFALWGGLTPSNLDQMESLADRGVIGFKAFMSNSGMEDFLRADDLTLLRGMKIAAKCGLLVAVHAESEEITSRLSAEAIARGATSWRDYLASRPVIAETEAIARAIHLAGEAGCALHIVHVSSPAGIAVIRDAQLRGADITCETCPHYFLLCDEDLVARGASVKCAPPVRPPGERDQMKSCLAAGAIDWIASDHSPSPASMKTGENAFTIWGGIAGVQSTLSAALDGDRLSPKQVADITATNIARRFRLPASKGSIAVGADADLTVVDRRLPHRLTIEDLLDRNRANPYVGKTFSATIRRTTARGKTIFDGQSVRRGLPARLIRPTA